MPAGRHGPTCNGQDVRNRGIAIIATPEKDEDVMLKHSPDGRYTIFLRGEIWIAIRPSRTKLQKMTQNKYSPGGFAGLRIGCKRRERQE